MASQLVAGIVDLGNGEITTSAGNHSDKTVWDRRSNPELVALESQLEFAYGVSYLESSMCVGCSIGENNSL